MVENLPTVQGTQVQSLGQEDPLKKRIATHSSILVWKIPWTEEPGGLQSMGLQKAGHDWVTSTHSHSRLYIKKEGVTKRYIITQKKTFHYIPYLDMQSPRMYFCPTHLRLYVAVTGMALSIVWTLNISKRIIDFSHLKFQIPQNWL